jgi:hypothetical protein
MPVELSPLEARIIGCLIEKQIATPDQYPLSINSLTAACNQKSNRDPVMHLDEREVQKAVDHLIRRNLILDRSGFGSRVQKYQHLFCNTEYGSLRFSAVQTAVLCELLLRGAQTPGELRNRAARLAKIADLTEVETALEDLMTRPDGPFVARLAREPGKREARYAHLFGDAPPAGLDSPSNHASSAGDPGHAPPQSPAIVSDSGRWQERVALLEEQVTDLQAQVATLRSMISGSDG